MAGVNIICAGITVFVCGSNSKYSLEFFLSKANFRSYGESEST